MNQADWVKIRKHAHGWMFSCHHCGDETHQPCCGNLDQSMDAMCEYVADHSRCPEPVDPLRERLEGEPIPAWYTEDQ